MVSLKVYTKDGDVIDTLDMEGNLLEEEINYQLLHDAVVMYEANLRQGTSSTKTRGEAAYSGRKPWVQKGTGRARAGSRGSPIWRGGGVAHGPKPRDFYRRLPKKALKKALTQAFIAKLKDEEVRVVDSVEFETPRTKEAAALLKRLGIDRSCLILHSENDRNLYLSARNIERVEVVPVKDVNAYHLLRNRYLLMSRETFFALTRRIGLENIRSSGDGVSRPSSGDTPSDSDGEV